MKGNQLNGNSTFQIFVFVSKHISIFLLQLDKFILLGHSFGGYLASSYAIRYPNRLHQLVLADPWGFPEKPPDADRNSQIPIWIKMVVTLIQPFNPLAGLRAAGPWGKSQVPVEPV